MITPKSISMLHGPEAMISRQIKPALRALKWMLCAMICCNSVVTPLSAKDDFLSDDQLEILRGMENRGASAIKPIHIPNNSTNQAHIGNKQQTWAERVWINPALARIAERTDAPWKEDAEKLLRAAPAAIFPVRIAPAPNELAHSARKLVEAGCNDPAVLILSALLDRMVQSDWRFVENCVAPAIKQMENNPEYKAVLTYYASHLSMWAYHLGGFPKKQKSAAESLQKAAFLMAADGSFLPHESDLFILDYLSNAQQPGMPEQMIEVAKDLPLPEWARKTLVGKAFKTIAWNSRGAGWADSVTEGGWKGFEENLEKARSALVEAWNLNPQSPYAASEMIAIVMAGAGENDDTLQLWFERTIAAQCDYPPAYKAMLWAYRPRWCGGHELMLAFGKACAATKRYDLDIPMFFTQACNDIVSEIGDWREFYKRPDVAKVLIELSEGLVREPSRQDERGMRLSFLAVNAWLVGDTKRSAQALAELNGPMHPDAVNKLASLGTSEAEFRKEISIAGSSVAADFRKAVELYESNKMGDAETIFKRIKSAAPQDVQSHIQDMLDLIDLENKLAKGEWVRLPVDPELRGWIQRSGSWSGTSDGKLVNHGNDGKGFIIHRVRIGPDFEMRVEYTVDAPSKCCKHCDIVFGWHAGFEEPFNLAFHGQNGTGPGKAWISSKCIQTKKLEKINAPMSKINVLVLQSKGGKFTFTTNDKEVFRDFTSDEIDPGPSDSRVGIGSFRWCRLNTTEVSKIEVRKLAN